MEIGICSFADLGTHPISGASVSAQQRLENLLEEIVLADELGLDVFAVGEHHRADYAVSSPTTLLAAAAVKTSRIKLSSGVTVLSSEDPVRVFQQFATIDLLSKGRAEILAGRGSFIESFPLFGYNLKDYDALYAEKLEMLVKLNGSEKITWEGKLTQTIPNRGVYPRPFQEKLPIWVAVGGTPESVVRAAEFGLPMTLAIIGGQPAQFRPYANLYRERYLQAGHSAADFQLAINSHTYIAENSQQALDEFYPPYADVMTRIGKERGWPGLSREQYLAGAGPSGALLIGSPQQVVDKILYEHELFGHTRFLAQMSIGALPHKLAMKSIELLGTKVLPQLKKQLQPSSSTQ
ncbi:LLM class flavin-dependent oxidoreductase [Flavihumibacter sp. CACIAM 22H1]|uniref:LLM class flavin-dependent oxidoreductase n=1 Tax=Flavihumibacter sp. CACIAM 22H1 TaxID=1812911 RepID=UPI0007A841B3|nr:LLM class flavin-dependent oxidoreductase [Flavihumibacter sp. CACIAM 22H1]KYP16572.1 MAG: luciferase [Flavihumibacter sp. CACIAM 22H1]